MLSPLKSQWQTTITEKSKSIIPNETLSPVNLPQLWDDYRARPIRSSCVFEAKQSPDSTTLYKSKPVIKRNAQLDKWETYAPLSKHTMYWLLISSTGWNDCKIDHLEVVTAFLGADVDDNFLLMEAQEDWPKGCMNNYPRGEKSSVWVIQIWNALHGLSEAPQFWLRQINGLLLQLHFVESETDPNLYIRNKSGILLLLFIDDMLLISQTQAASEAAQIRTGLTTTDKIT